MYFIIYQPSDRSFTKFLSITNKLTDDLNLAFHSLDLKTVREKFYQLQLKDRDNYSIIFFKYVR